MYISPWCWRVVWNRKTPTFFLAGGKGWGGEKTLKAYEFMRLPMPPAHPKDKASLKGLKDHHWPFLGPYFLWDGVVSIGRIPLDSL